MLTIVMYHYVRGLANTDYPRIKGLLTERFEGQLDYLLNHYTIVDIESVTRAILGGASLPVNACLLTFDDGFIDHYETVLPRLCARRITGSFHPSAYSVTNHSVLDVHKIHFILASSTAATVRSALSEELETFRRHADIATDQELEAKYGTPTRFDDPDVAFIKRVLQKGLRREVRASITARLFAQFVTEDETSFAQQLYMSVDQIRELARAGMVIGGHGYRHEWLGELTLEEQQEEIDGTLRFLDLIYGRTPRDWVMCYPYGSYNDETLRIVRAKGALLGLTTRAGLVADLSRPLELERLDTNDLPFQREAPLSDWTMKVQANRQLIEARGWTAG